MNMHEGKFYPATQSQMFKVKPGNFVNYFI